MTIGNNQSIRHTEVPTLRPREELVRSTQIDRQVQILFQMVDRTDEKKLDVLSTLWRARGLETYPPLTSSSNSH